MSFLLEKAPVVVTGASGFLGGRLVEMLVQRGERVVVLARAGSRLDHLRGLCAEEVGAPVALAAQVRIERVELVPGDALDQAVRGARLIYHCAGCSTDWASWQTYHAGNVMATQAMLRSAAAAGPQFERFVHVSTTDVYGYPEHPGDEHGALVDVGLGYNRSKIAGEHAVRQAAANGLPVTVLRPATIYGPRGTAFVSDIVKLLRERTMAVVDGGEAPAGLVYVDDVCEAMLAAGASTRSVGEAYNVSSTDSSNWRTYCDLLARAMGLSAPWLDLSLDTALALGWILEAPHRFLRVPGRPLLTRHAVYLLGRDQQFVVRKALEDFGWGPRVGLEEGIARSAEWCRGLI